MMPNPDTKRPEQSPSSKEYALKDVEGGVCVLPSSRGTGILQHVILRLDVASSRELKVGAELGLGLPLLLLCVGAVCVVQLYQQL